MDILENLNLKLNATIAIEWLRAGMMLEQQATIAEKKIGNNRTLWMQYNNQMWFYVWGGLGVWDIVLESGPIYGI